MHLEGYTQCNGNTARVVARVDLARRAGTGHLIPLENPGGFQLGMARDAVATPKVTPKAPRGQGKGKKKNAAAEARSPAARGAKKATPRKAATPNGAHKATPARLAAKRVAPATVGASNATHAQPAKRTRARK